MILARALLCLLAAIVVAGQSWSQTGNGVVAGTITVGNGEAASSATVTLEDSKLGAVADENGRFVIEDVPTGTYKLKVRLIGYEQGELLSVRVMPGDTSRVAITLRENEIEMAQILVTGSRRQPAEDTRPSVTTMTPKESKYLPGAAEDVLRSLQALPGVTSVNDFSSQLVVRGSGPDQNLIMIDGFEVINPYRLYGVVSMFNPETVSDISLQTGGFAAQYGDRLSAVIDVKNREGKNDAPFGAKLNFSLTNMNLIFEGALPFESSSYLLSLRRTYYDLILGPVLKKAKLVEGDVALPNFRDVQFRATLPVGEANRIILNALTSRDGVSLISGVDRNRPDSVNVFDKSDNSMVGATWQFTPERNLIVSTRLSWYRNAGSGAFDGTFADPSQSSGQIGRGDTIGLRYVHFGVTYDYFYTKISASQNLLWTRGNHTLEGGYGIDFLRTDFVRYFDIDRTLRDLIASRGFVVPTDQTEVVRYKRYNVYAQDRIAIGDRLFVQPGLRLDVYPFLKTKAYLSPRINMSYKVGEQTTIRGAYGIYFQSPGMEKQTFNTPITFNDAAFATLVAEQAQHYILGFDRMVSSSWQFRFETYLKNFRNVIAPEKLQGSRWVSYATGDSILSTRGWTAPVRMPSDSLTYFPSNDATGKSYGFEILFQKIRSQPGDRITGWVSYALSYARRERDGVTTPFLFDQRHAMNVVGQYRISEGWDVGLRYTLRSGRPHAVALGIKPRIAVVTLNGVDTPVIQTDRDGKVILDVDYERDRYSGRLDLYSSLDLRVTTYPSWWGLNWSIYLDVQNVLNRSNMQAKSYYIDAEGNLRSRAVDGIPIFPSLGFSVSF